MNTHELIDEIVSQAKALQYRSRSGGDIEFAFDICADRAKLESILDDLVDFQEIIDEELSNATA